jgi:hypothetical protein
LFEFERSGKGIRVKWREEMKVKVKLSHYTPWRRLGGEEV